MKFNKHILLILTMLMSASAAAVEYLEYSDEGPVTAFYLGKDLTGYVKTKMCDSCKVITHKITPDAKSFLDGKEVPLKTFVLSTHKPSVVRFSAKDKKLTRIIWYSSNR